LKSKKKDFYVLDIFSRRTRVPAEHRQQVSRNDPHATRGKNVVEHEFLQKGSPQAGAAANTYFKVWSNYFSDKKKKKKKVICTGKKILR
jgi:hypothetical protein